jgi:hypothetical protein
VQKLSLLGRETVWREALTPLLFYKIRYSALYDIRKYRQLYMAYNGWTKIADSDAKEFNRQVSKYRNEDHDPFGDMWACRYFLCNAAWSERWIEHAKEIFG